MKEKTCCFTGHREIDAKDRNTLKSKLTDTVRACISEGYRYFGVGGALGFDTLAATVVLSLKGEFPNIALILVLPCPEQTKYWKAEDVAVYEDIMRRADKCVYTADHYFGGCMQKRNRHLVDESSACIAYLRRESGGTAYTVRYAEEKGVKVFYL